MTARRICNRRRPEWVQTLEERRLFANLGDLGIYLVDHATHARVESPAAGTQVEVHATFAANGIAPGTVTRVQRVTENGTLYTEMAAPASWAGHATVDRNLFTWTVPPTNAWVTVTLDPRNTVSESNEGDNAVTLTLQPAPPAAAPVVPAYHSLPGARYAIYLDFDGNEQAEFAGSHDVTTPVFDTDGNPSSFSAGELDEIRQVWARVAEDYAPFSIDVTTQLPADGQYTRWQRVAIGGASCDWYEFTAAGTAIPGSFTDGSGSAAFVFTQQANGDGSTFQYPVATIADSASHEAGHTFGLLHQSSYDADGHLAGEYNPGDGTWGPIMGKSGNAVSTWYNGPTDVSATSYQDDMSIIASAANGFGYRPDDVGNDDASAKSLGAFAGGVSAAGIIGTNEDVDVYSVALPGGSYHFAADVAADGPNLDAVLEVRDATGAVVATANPADSQSSAVDLSLPAGTYYVAVRSTGVYGWVGQYTVSVADASQAPPATSPGPVPTPAPPVTQGPAADLTARMGGRVPKRVSAGAKGKAVVTVANVGQVAAKGAVTVKVYAASEPDLSGGGVLLGKAVVKGNLASGGKRVVRVPMAYPKSMTAGSYYLLGTVEGQAGLAEASAANNVDASAGQVKVVVPASKLTAAVVAPKGRVALKQEWAATVAVRNEGTGVFSGKSIVQLYASTDGVQGNEDDVLVGTANVAGVIGVNASKRITMQAQSGGASGVRYLFAVVAGDGGAARKAVKVRFA